MSSVPENPSKALIDLVMTAFTLGDAGQRGGTAEDVFRFLDQLPRFLDQTSEPSFAPLEPVPVFPEEPDVRDDRSGQASGEGDGHGHSAAQAGGPDVALQLFKNFGADLDI